MYECLSQLRHSHELLRTLTKKKLTGVHSSFRKRFMLRTITNTDGEELITDGHEINVQSAVMSGLEDVNSSQSLLGQI